MAGILNLLFRFLTYCNFFESLESVSHSNHRARDLTSDFLLALYFSDDSCEK